MGVNVHVRDNQSIKDYLIFRFINYPKGVKSDPPITALKRQGPLSVLSFQPGEAHPVSFVRLRSRRRSI